MALILGIMVTTVSLSLSSVILSRSIVEGSAARRYKQQTQAFWLSEAGVERALYELNHGDGNWTGWSNQSGTKVLTAALGAVGEYTVVVTDPGTDNPTIDATGYSPSATSPNRIERSLAISVGVESCLPFTYAGYGKSGFTMSGNGKTDSYDASLGAYGGANQGANGDIGTNSIGAGAISLSGNATVNGDAGTGSGGTVSISGNAAVNGTVTDDRDEDLPSVEVPSSLSSLASSGTYSIGGNNTITLAAGDYKFDSLSVNGNGDLTLQGPMNIYLTGTNALTIAGNGKVIIEGEVKIYTDGKCNIAGNGVVNNTTLPENFIINSTYSGGADGITIAGNGDLYGAVYAPDCEVKVSGNGDVFGALIGDDITISGNGDIHFDESLTDVEAGGPGGFVVSNWEDQENPFLITP